MTETKALVLEIGCEEIPARFLDGAERELGERLASALGEARLLPPASLRMITASTPRRLIAYAPALLPEQPGRVNRIVGPPVKMAFDKDGKRTRAAESFASKNNAQASDLKRVTTEKGEYLALDVPEPGRRAVDVLSALLPGVLGGMTFPKNMYWTAKAGPLFVRPIRWILALFGNEGDLEVVPFEFAGVVSGSATLGHRLKGSGPLKVGNLNLDLLLKNNLVIAHRAERRERAREGIQVLLEGTGLRATADDWLEAWVVNSTEWPAPLAGSFDPRYLALPREVLVTVMRDHQKYFAVEDSAGNLEPRFITVLNVPGDPKGLIRQGHERVLAARFADAEFFWQADQKIPLRERIPMLERVTYQAKLGTYGAKIRRMKVLAEKTCAELERSGQMSGEERRHALRAVELCKCDLTTQMVQEFTELQGVIGGLYAKPQGESSEVADAIYDHYRPASAEDSCPRSVIGAVVSLADKLDSVIAGFSAGLEPTGSSDPFGLRRAGNGVIRLAVEALPGLNLAEIENYALDQIFNVSDENPLRNRLCEFLRDRMDFYFREAAGLRYDTVRAVLYSWLNPEFASRIPSAALELAKSLESIRDTEDFRALAEAAKRTRNILTKSGSMNERVAGSEDVDSEKLKEPAERDLYAAYQSTKDRIDRLRNERRFGEAFREMATLRPYVDQFFDKVLVMAEDKEVRRNRLQLLNRLNEDVFTNLADLAEIVVDPQSAVKAKL